MTYLFNNNVNPQNNNIIVSTTNPLPVTTLGGIYNSSGNLDTSTDGFGRVRTSNPETLFDSSFRYSDDYRNWDSVTTGNGSNTFIATQACISMNVNTTSGDKVVRETKRVFKYQPGKSLFILSSFVMNQPKANLRQRIGYFSANNGYFLEHDGTGLYIVERSGVSGSAVDTRIPQDNWNVDTLKVGSASNVVVNVANSQIFWADMEWLGVGSVRTGFIVDGQLIVAHIFHHANKLPNVYMTTATLPLRAEIENTGTTSSNSRLQQICNSVMSEGGYHPSVATRAASTTLTGINLSDVVYRPLVSIRLKSTTPDAMVLPALIQAYGLQNVPYIWRVSMNGSITGGTWNTTGSDSAVEYNTTGTGISGDDVLLEGVFGGGTIGAPLSLNLAQFNSGYQLRRYANGTPIVFTLSALATTNNDDAVGSVSWEEM